MLVMLVVFGAMSMHSIPVVSSTHEEMTAATAAVTVGGHERLHGAAASGESVAEQMQCPSGHQMMHPCIGTITSWPATSVPTGVMGPPTVSDVVSARVMTVMGRAGRAPPWSVSSLDESVLLRV